MTKLDITKKALALMGFTKFANCTAEQFAKKHTKEQCLGFLKMIEDHPSKTY